MAQQMDSGNVPFQRQGPPYGHYEGNPPPSQSGGGWYSQDPPPASNMYDDAFMDAFAQRLSQRMAQGPGGKAYSSASPTAREKATPGQRMALAIVSVVMLIPLAGIALGVSMSAGALFLGLIALGGICLTLIIINAIFNVNS